MNTIFKNCEDDDGPMRPLSFYVDRLLERIHPRVSCEEQGRGRVVGGEVVSVVSLRVGVGEEEMIDRELGIPFEPLDCAVYRGRQMLGRYNRVGVRHIAAFDASGLWLGDFKRQGDARRAICHRWNTRAGIIDARSKGLGLGLEGFGQGVLIDPKTGTATAKGFLVDRTIDGIAGAPDDAIKL